MNTGENRRQKNNVDGKSIHQKAVTDLNSKKTFVDKTHYLWYDVLMHEITADESDPRA